APEQVFGEKDVDHRADIWALGIIFYQCLAGALPTAGDNVGQVLKNVLGKPFEPLAELVPGVPPEISELVARMLARERSQRPDDLREVLAVLGSFASERGLSFDAPAEHVAGDEPQRSITREPRPIAHANKVDPLARTQHELGATPRRARRRAALVALVPAAAIPFP